VALSEYVALLRWTAKRRRGIETPKVPPKLATILSKIGIEASMWRDLVWNFKRYFGRSNCAGSPETLLQEANRHDRWWYHGQRHAAECFVT